MLISPSCPQCGAPLLLVTQSLASPLNADQWASHRPGDYYCLACPDNGRGMKPLAYFWQSEVEETPC